MKIAYKLYLVVAILVLSFSITNYISGGYSSKVVNSLKKYGKRLRIKGKNFKRSVGQVIFGKKYGQESVIEQVGAGQEITMRKTPSEIAKEFNQQNKGGLIAWIKKTFGFDMRTESEKQLATVLINNKEIVGNTYDPEHWQFQLTGSYLPADKTIHKLRLSQEKTIRNQEYTFEWYQTSLTNEDKVDFSFLNTEKGAVFAVAVEKSNETGKIINLFCLNIYPNERNELQALPIASTINLGIWSQYLGYYLNSENEKRLTDYNALLTFVEDRLIKDKQILSFTGKKHAFIDKIIPKGSRFYPTEEIKKYNIDSKFAQAPETQLMSVLDSNDEFQNDFLKYNAPYLKDPISRLRLEIEENVYINHAKYKLQWYQAAKNTELTDAIVVVVALKNQSDNIVEFLCLEIQPRNQAKIEFKSHEYVTKGILAKSSYEITEGDYPLTKLEELEALIKFTEKNVQELYQLPYLVDFSGRSGKKVID